ncbi:hypothetical protein BC830DRAFT_1142386 [Chytriomyces sp. MP71]|nr:hypothetical protein BC830DRAFT_1142386 [Chytriomyces sp. MP71]
MGKKKEKDFKKVKLKVGGKKDDGNNTNVSFKTKSIVVPNQSVADADRANKDPAAFDLRSSVSMLGHYASANRKDALSRLKDLATDNPRSMVLHLSQLISAVAPLLLDREFDVRRVLLQFAKALVKNVPLNLLRPFVPVVVTYSCSAMNHIVNDIRFDAVRFLNIWIEVFPSFFASGSSQIIQNFMSLLHLKKQKVSGKDQYIKKSKDAMMDSDQLTVLSSLNQLLRLSSTESFLAASSESPLQSLYFRKDITLTRHSGRWAHQSKFKLDVFSTTIGTASKKIQSGRIELSLGDTVVTAKPVANAWGPKDFVVAIVPACVDVWLDSAPQVLSGVMINEGAAIEKLNLAMGILHQALTANFGLASDAERKDMVNSFAKHVLVSFPYGNNAVGIKTENCERILQEMNIKTCEIVSLFKKDLHTQEWEEGMFDYLFKTIAVKDDSLPLGSLKMLFPLCASTIKDSPRGRDLLGIMVRRHKETPPRSASWIELFKFIRRVFMTINPSINDAIKADWITYLPRALWSLAHSNAAISREILTFLSEVLRSLPALDSPIASNIHNGLVPFFHVVTASKGPIFGPFLLLPVECQKTAIELLYYLPQWSSKLLSALAHCFTCMSALVDPHPQRN